MDQIINEFAKSMGQTARIAFLIDSLTIVWYIVNYVFQSLSLHKLGKAMNINAYGLAWVPCARYWVAGCIVDKHEAKTGKDHKFRWVLVCLLAIMAVLLVIFTITFMISAILPLLSMGGASDPLSLFGLSVIICILLIMSCIAFSAFWAICFYRIFELCKPQSPAFNFIIGMLVPYAFPFVLFSCANAYIRRTEELQAMEAARIAEEAATSEEYRTPDDPDNDDSMM